MYKPNSQEIAQTLSEALPRAGDTEPLHAPEFSTQECRAVQECLESGWVSYAAPAVDQFEARLGSICDRPYVVATNTGTAALHTALMLLGVKSGDEVIMPSLTFVATANACAYCGAIPHFVDSDPNTLGISPEKLAAQLDQSMQRSKGTVVNRQTGNVISAIVAVHVLGHPAADDQLVEIAEAWGLPLIVDATESLGSLYLDRPAGSWGDIAVLSFNGNKIVTTGGGGAVMCSDKATGERARHLTTTAKRPHAWEFQHDEVGYNYRLPGLLAALGLGQLERLDDMVSRKRRLAEQYRAVIDTLSGVDFIQEPSGAKSNYWLNAIRIPGATIEHRDAVIMALHDAGLMARPLWKPMHQLPMFASAPHGQLSMVETLSKEIICLPSSPRLVNDG